MQPLRGAGERQGVRRHEMENPKDVESGFVFFVAFTGVVCAILSVVFWNAAILLYWVLALIALAFAFVMITAVYAITVWPLLLLIAKVFGKVGPSLHSGQPAGRTPAEPGAPADGRGQRSWWT